jgi:acyl-CoA dehydrogenase family protein 9
MNEQSFVKALFFGVVAEDVLFPYPQLAPAERDRVRDLVRDVRRFLDVEVDPERIDRERAIDDRTRASMAKLGLFGLGIPAEHGGLGLSQTAQARVFEEVATRDASLALTLVAHGAIGLRGLLLFGTDAQKRELLPALASGEKIAAFALTERSGSDAGSIRCHAAKDETTGAYRLVGEKPWVTNGAIAGLVTVIARTSALDEGHKPRLTALLVDRGPGVSVGQRLDTLGVRGADVSTLGFDTTVPKERVLGDVGKGYKVAMAVLNEARLALSATMVGQARTIVNQTVELMGSRRSFGRVIGEFPILKDKITKMMADVYAIESMTYLTTGLADRGLEDYSLESAICRVASSEALWRVVNEGMQAAAGRGYVADSPLGRQLRDARASFVLDATNETLRCFIALSGLRGPGMRLSEVVGAMYEPVKGFGLLRDFAVRKVREALRRERVTRAHPLLAREAVIFEEVTDELSRAAHRALRDHGAEIAEMQYTQMRIANIAIDLYALAACLSRTTLAIEQRGEGGASREIDLTVMFASAAQGRMAASLARLEHNDDELRKSIAARTYTDRGYPFDIL